MASNMPYAYNISFTALANKPDQEPRLTAEELWLGIRHVARKPQEFAPYVAKCDVLWEGPDKSNLGRAVTLADGGVHTDRDQVLYQTVHTADRMLVEACTLETDAKTTFLLSYGPEATVSPDSTDVSFTVIYELKVKDVEPGSDKAKSIEKDYPELARKACTSTIEQIRQCKVDGRLARWARAVEV